MCNLPCSMCGDNGECDISHYCENNVRYYCCSKDSCNPDKGYYPDMDCIHNWNKDWCVDDRQRK